MLYLVLITFGEADICPENYTLSLRDLSDVTEESIQELLGEPQRGDVFATDDSLLPPNLPPYLVPPANVLGLLPFSDGSTVKMIDLGQGQH